MKLVARSNERIGPAYQSYRGNTLSLCQRGDIRDAIPKTDMREMRTKCMKVSAAELLPPLYS